MSSLLYLPLFITITWPPAGVRVLGCDCETPKNFLILFDDFMNREEIFECQGYVARLASSLRSISDGNRVAVGTFSGIITSLKQSETLKPPQLAHAILDPEIPTATSFNLKQALAITLATIKATSPNKHFIALFIVANKHKDDNKNSEMQASAQKIYKNYPNFVGYAAGIDASVSDGVVQALHNSDEYRAWYLNSVFSMKDVQGEMRIRLGCQRNELGNKLG